MRVIISAGGTGGHIYPALAIIKKIKEKEPSSEILYIGTHNRMEKDIIPKENIPFKSIEIYGFNRKNIFKNIKTIKCLMSAKKKCLNIIKEFKPDIVIGVGGYVTVPVILSAHKLGIKTFIHEQNSVSGKANLFLNKYVDKIGISFKSSIDDFSKDKVIFTGNPCSSLAHDTKKIDKTTFGFNKDKKLVIIVMGSLGASVVNNYIVENRKLFNENYEVLFITGKSEYEDIIKNNFPNNVKVVPYVDHLTGIMKSADLIVTRSGASTLSEIIELNIPSILIPSPYVPNNHQYKNAMDLVNNASSILIEEKDLKGDILFKNIDEVLNNKKLHDSMSNSLNKLKVDNSSDIIYNCIKDLVGRK